LFWSIFGREVIAADRKQVYRQSSPLTTAGDAKLEVA
jgi:hypothetical protein